MKNINDYYKYTVYNKKKALYLDLNKIKITKATYGSNLNNIDVFHIIIDHIKKKENILISNETFKEDPHYGIVKNLFLEINNKFNFEIKENNFLIYTFDYNKKNLNELNDLENINTKNNINNILGKKNKNIINNYKYEYYKDNINFEPIIGFIILRHVSNEKEDKLWIKCYDSIRKFYKNRILIIDDNSDFEFLTVNKKLDNTSIIFSEYKSRGELLPLFYFYKNHFCDRVVILHDSMYIKEYFDFNNIQNYNYFTRLFSFSNKWYSFDVKNLPNQINVLNNNEEIFNFHTENKYNLVGCFGCSIIIDHKFINYIQKKFSIFNLLNIIKCRDDRKCFERTLSLILEKGLYDLNIKTKESLFGTIHTHISKQKKEKIYIYKNFIGR